MKKPKSKKMGYVPTKSKLNRAVNAQEARTKHKPRKKDQPVQQPTREEPCKCSCGEYPVVEQIERDRFAAVCLSCGTRGAESSTEHTAIWLWNDGEIAFRAR